MICRGTPIEEIYDYNLMFETFMDLGRYMQEESKLYMESLWRAPVCPGEPDLNFVKPLMVDREGTIMHLTNVKVFGYPNYAKPIGKVETKLLMQQIPLFISTPQLVILVLKTTD